MVREAARSQRLDDALYAADQLLQTDRESEEAFRVLMEVYYLRGDQAAALSAWDRCREMLRQLYGVAPSAATQALGQTILEAVGARVQRGPLRIAQRQRIGDWSHGHPGTRGQRCRGVRERMLHQAGKRLPAGPVAFGDGRCVISHPPKAHVHGIAGTGHTDAG